MGEADTTAVPCHMLIVPAVYGAGEPSEGEAGFSLRIGGEARASTGSCLCQAGP